MQADRWQQIERLFHSALQRPPRERAALLAEACAGDEELRREVESLLAEYAPGDGLLEGAASGLAADWLQEQEHTTIKQSLGHFRILSQLGKGGMGEVYLAEDHRLRRKVALKLLPREFAGQSERLSRFKQEARAASALNHPNIVTIYEIDQTEGTHFIATEYVEGQTLRALLRQGPLPLTTVLEMAVQATSALAAAHAAGIIHRDIKPENIMRRADGLVKVLDFGLAKLIRSEPATADSATAPVESTPGVIMGTLAYMSPEQARGLEVDARTDIFSLGAVLYELVRGQRAFRGASQMAVLTAVIEQEPEPLPASVPPELAKVILRCLRKEPAQRYQTMADLKVALEDVRAETAGSGRQVLAQTQRRWAWAVWPLASLVVVLLGVFLWQAWRPPESTEPLRAVPFTTLRGVQRYPSFSPEGNRVAFTWTGSKQDNFDIYVQQIGAGAPFRLTTDSSNDYNPVWSPDDRWIAFLRSQKEAGKSDLRLIAPLGGLERKLAELRVRDARNVIPPYLAWCPDGACLVATDSPGEGQPDALFVISLEGEKRQLTHPPPGAGDSNPAISPDGRWLVFRRNTSAFFTGALYKLALGGGMTAAGEPQRLTLPVLDAAYPAWLPDSQEILFAPTSTGGLRRLVVAGENTPQRLPFVGEDGTTAAVSRPQPGRPVRLVYSHSVQDSNIWRVETAAPGAAASTSAASIASTRMEGMVQLSPDGKRVAFWSLRSGEHEIWLADPDGANPVQLTFMGAGVRGYPHWSPDSQTVVFHSALEGQWEVFAIPAVGGKPRNLTAHPANDAGPSFSRDGQWIYFTSNRNKEGQTWKIPATGGEARLVTNGPGNWPQESPDGAYLYYLETLDGPCPLWRIPVSGGVPIKVVEGVVVGNYVVLEKGIYYITRLAGEGGGHYFDLPLGETQLQYFDFATGKSTTVARNLGNVGTPLTASADGRLILYDRLDFAVDDLMLVENFR